MTRLNRGATYAMSVVGFVVVAGIVLVVMRDAATSFEFNVGVVALLAIAMFFPIGASYVLRRQSRGHPEVHVGFTILAIVVNLLLLLAFGAAWLFFRFAAYAVLPSV